MALIAALLVNNSTVRDVEEYFRVLESGDEASQILASRGLREFVETEHRLLSIEQFSKFMTDICACIFQLINSDDTRHVCGGIYVIQELIQVSHEENESKIIRFSNYIRIVFQQPEEKVDNWTLILASHALGLLARSGGPLTADFVEFEAKRAFEWLFAAGQTESDASLKRKKLAAVLVIKELASNSPVLFYRHVSTVFEYIRTALHDSHECTREAATLALRACLELILQRESRLCVQWYYKVYELARAGFSQGTASTIHGSLLVLGELLLNTGHFMVPRFAEVCDTILKYKDYKSVLVRRTVISLLPELAQFSPDAFVREYLTGCIEYLFQAVEQPMERDAAFHALGRLSMAVSHNILPHLVEIVLLARENLTEQSSGGSVLDSSSEDAFACISMLAQAVGPSLLEHSMSDGLLGEMFSNGLSEALIKAVSDLRTFIPSLRQLVTAHLLHSLSFALSGEPFHAPVGGGRWSNDRETFGLLNLLENLDTGGIAKGFSPVVITGHGGSYLDSELDGLDWRECRYRSSMFNASYFPTLDYHFRATPQTTSSATIPSSSSSASSSSSYFARRSKSKQSTKKRDLVILALRTLREFDFDQINLLPFLHESVLCYMDDPDAQIRREVAKTCGALLLPSSVQRQSSCERWDATAKLTSSGVRKLLMLGVSDPDPSIRSTVLECLRDNEQYDEFLMQEDTLSALFVALQDEDFLARRISMAVASRLIPRNPAHIHSAIRKCIHVAMAQLEFSPGQSHREEGAVILLGDIVAGFNSFSLATSSPNNIPTSTISPLIAPSIVSLIKILLSKLSESRSTMSTAILRTLGEIASINGVDMNAYISELMPLIIEILQNQGSADKRKCALWTLGQFVRSTGRAIVPLLEYPGLLDTLLSVIKGGSNTATWELREEALKTLGTLGALDPFETKRGSPKQIVNDVGRGIRNNANKHGKDGSVSATVVTISTKSTSLIEMDDDMDALGPKDEEYYPTVAINALMRIIQDETLSTHHSMVVQALSHIFRSLGINCVPFLPQVMPCILYVASECEQELRKVLFQNISVVVSISKQHIRPFMDDIFHLIHSYWYENLDQVFVLIEEISRALREEFTPYVKSIVPNLLQVLKLMHSGGASNESGGGKVLTRSNMPFRSRPPSSIHLTPSQLQLPQQQQQHATSTKASLPSIGSSLSRQTKGRVPDLTPALRSPDDNSSVKASTSMSTTGVHGGATAASTASAAELTRSSQSHLVMPSPVVLHSSSPHAVTGKTKEEELRQKVTYSKYATRGSARRILKTVEILSFTLTDYFYLIIPALIDLVESELALHEVRMYTMHTLGSLSSHASFCDYALNAMQCLLRLLRRPTKGNVKCQAIDTLCVFALRFPNVFSMFQQSVDACFRGKSITNYSLERYKATIKLLNADGVSPNPRDVSNHIEMLLSTFYGRASSSTTSKGGPKNTGGDADVGPAQKKLSVNHAKLKKIWEASERATSEEWVEWTRRLSVELLRESPSSALRACSAVAQVYNPLTKELFNAAFVSCWSSLSEHYQHSLIVSLEKALKSAHTPPSTLKIMLDLAEFMEHDDRVLPIGIRNLGDYAERCHAYAKALHYKEMVFRNLPGACTEGLISINNQLEQPEAAVGVLHYVQQLQRRQYQISTASPASKTIPEVNMLDFGVAAAALSPQQQYFQLQAMQQGDSSANLQPQQPSLSAGTTKGAADSPTNASAASPNGSNSSFFNDDGILEDGTIKLKETWFEKLGRWEEALASYEEKLVHLRLDEVSNTSEYILSGKDLENMTGKVRCLFNLGDYEQLMSIAPSVWSRVNGVNEMEVLAPIFCQSSWACGDWDSMADFSTYIPENDLTGYLLRAVLSLQKNDFAQARLMIDRGRSLLGEQLGVLVGESYNRAYRQIVTVQQFAELDEIYEYKKLAVSDRYNEAELSQFRAKLQKIWSKRIRGCQENVSVWQNILAAHSLVLPEREDIQKYIKFSTICRKSNRLGISLSTLQRLGVVVEEDDESATANDKLHPDVAFAYLKYKWAVVKAENLCFQKEHQIRQSHYFVGGYSPGRKTTFTVVPIDQAGGMPGGPGLSRFLSSGSSTSTKLESSKLAYLERRSIVIEQLDALIHRLKVLPVSDHHGSSRRYTSGDVEMTRKERDTLLVRCLLKSGSWNFALEEFQLNADLIESVLHTFQSATQLEADNYKAWHAWALMNFRAVEHYHETLSSLNDYHDLAAIPPELLVEEEDDIVLDEQEEDDYLEKEKSSEGGVATDEGEKVVASLEPEQTGTEEKLKDPKDSNPARSKKKKKKRTVTMSLLERKKLLVTQRMNRYVVPAIVGFFRSISLGQSSDSRSVLQDILRLLTLWFSHGARKEVEEAIQQGFAIVNIGTWLDVVPQLIARIHIQTPEIKQTLHQLLVTLGIAHPHALLYPLTVAAKSINHNRKVAADQILLQLKKTKGIDHLVDEAQLVSHELIRVAILWHEEWFETLEDASRAYFSERDLDGMIELLEPLHAKLNGQYESVHEHEFIRKFGRELDEASRYVERFRRTQQDVDISQAWELYYHVFRKIHKELQSEKVLQLEEVSPALLQARGMSIAVPVTYVAGKDIVRIEGFAPSMRVIPSKHRPRQITLRGSDGREYLFLLKGHEDLRQDERVMQLFGLVNTLLQKERETNRYDLTIERYSVIPLSHNVGISEWLPNTDTFHALIERFRVSRSVLLNIEQRLISKLAPDFYELTIIQRVEAFCHALSHTNGQDLGKVLWLKSRNSEIWLDRRTNYTRSLATMSMVGYVLGLGDRHPSNLMLDRSSGKVIHIDFGDCFEVAMNRDRVPEKVPFRLTRMLIAAMEVSGVEGNFRYTCESVMQVLRANRDSVMAMLEAFVHDPLINWRLLATTKANNGNTAVNNEVSSSSGAALSSLPKSNKNNLPPVHPTKPPTAMKRADSSPQGSTTWDEAAISSTSLSIATDNLKIDGNSVKRPRARTEGRLGHAQPEENDNNPRTQRENRQVQLHAAANVEALNQRAIAVLKRVNDKLTGMDFSISRQDVDKDSKSAANFSSFSSKKSMNSTVTAPVSYQVQKLIIQATSHENLCQSYIGWCATW